MLFPDKRYDFTSRRQRKSNLGSKLLIIIAAVIVIGGTAAFFLIRSRSQNDTSNAISEFEAIYEYWKVNKYDNVIELSEKALSENPVNEKGLALGGFAYFYKALGEFSVEERLTLIDKAIVNLRKLSVLENNPYPEETEYILGKAYFHKGKYYTDQSIDHLKKSLDLGFQADDIYEYLGLAYSEINQYEQSVEYFIMAAEYSETPLLYLTIAQTYYKMNDKRSSEEYLLRTINSTEDTNLEEKCRFLLAQIYLDSENYIKAIDQFDKVIEDNPQSADAHYQLGVIYDSMNDNIKARAEWRKALQIDPSHYGARLHYYN